MSAKFSDHFEFERVLWQKNVARVAGVDEAVLQTRWFKNRDLSACPARSNLRP